MMKRIIYFLILVCFTLMNCTDSGAQEKPKFNEVFQAGVQHYAEKKFIESKADFEKALALDPYNSAGLTNLALVHFQLGQKFMSLGLLRKSAAVDPNLSVTKAGLKFVESQLEIKEIPHQIEFYESLREKLLVPMTLNFYLLISAALLFLSGFSLLTYFGKKRKAYQEEGLMPGLPILGLTFTLIFLVSAVLTVLKLNDLTIPRATIIEEKVALQTAPGENQASVVDLYGGMEVIIQSSNKDWVQVTYPGGMTGWIKSVSVIMTSGI